VTVVFQFTVTFFFFCLLRRRLPWWTELHKVLPLVCEALIVAFFGGIDLYLVKRSAPDSLNRGVVVRGSPDPAENESDGNYGRSPLTLTLSPQGRGEGTGEARRLGPSCFRHSMAGRIVVPLTGIAAEQRPHVEENHVDRGDHDQREDGGEDQAPG